jgi:Fe2+ or Zn2+ uptake regulation protein
VETEPFREDHLRLYCRRCGQTAELGDVWLTEGLVDTLRAEHGFHADPTHFPIAGTCRACAERLSTA